VLGSNVWAGGYELDLVLRRGRRIVFCEVKAKGGPGYGDPLEMITREKLRRLWQAGDAWLASHPEATGLDVVYEAVAISEGKLSRVPVIPVLSRPSA
jgi:Holliday junction resolvase-like predicted endonuclease